MVKYNNEINIIKEANLEEFLDAAEKFCEEFKEDIEKEKEEYLKKHRMYK